MKTNVNKINIKIFNKKVWGKQIFAYICLNNLKLKVMKNLGKLRADKNSTFGNGDAIIVSEKNGTILVFNPASFDSDEQMHETAKIMASSFELLEQRNELLEALKNILPNFRRLTTKEIELYNKAKQAIEKIETI